MHRTQCVAVYRRYECNVCGEGGEYESLVLDCPLFKHARIVLDSWEAVDQSADAFAPVGHLHPVAYHLEPKGLTGTALPGGTPAATPFLIELLQNPSDAHDLKLERLVSMDTRPQVTPSATPAATPLCTDPPREKSHSNCHTPPDSQPAASRRVSEQSISKDHDLPAVSEKAPMQPALDNVWAKAVVFEVPRQISRSIAAETPNARTETQSGEAARHSVPSVPSRQSVPAWSADVQVQCGRSYVRAVCCPVQQAEGLGSSEATADALNCALAAVQQGQ